MRTGWLLLYWILGCYIWGAAEAEGLKQCPNQQIKVDLVKIVAWPYAIGAVMVLGVKWHDDHPKVCE